MVKYGKTEMVPPTPAEIPQAIAQFGKLVQSGITMKWTQLTVKVDYLNLHVCCKYVG